MKPLLDSLPRIYALTDYVNLDHKQVVRITQQLLKAGVKILQYRNKDASADQCYQQAKEIKAICHDYDSILIINDDPELAKKIDADGVHIGQHDASIKHVRDLLPDKIIGVSCYNQLSPAIDAQQQSVDYIAFGAFFPTRSKSKTVPAPIELLEQAKQVINIPVVAIGGINLENANNLLHSGADFIALMSSLYVNSDPYSTAKKFLSLTK